MALTFLTIPVYLLLGAGGYLTGAPSLIFPPAGLALALIIWFGVRAMPGLWLGAFALNHSLIWMTERNLTGLFTLSNLSTAAGMATGAVLQAWIGACLLRRWQPEDWLRMEREQDVMRLFALGGLLAGLCSPSIGTLTMLAAGALEREALVDAWWTWYLGDLFGVLVFAPLILIILNPDQTLWKERRRVLLPMLLPLGLTGLAFYSAAQWERQQHLVRIQQAGTNIAEKIADRLMTIQAILSSLRQTLATIPDLNQTQFEQLTGMTLSEHPDLRALSLVALVERHERAEFEQGLTLENRSAAITEMDDQGRLIAAAARPNYAPVRLIAPRPSNEAALGFDNLSHPVRRAALEQSGRSRALALAVPIRLAQTAPDVVGMLVILPVEDPRSQGPDGRPPLRGFVTAAVELETLVSRAIRGKLPDGLMIELADRPSTKVPEDARTILYRSESSHQEDRSELDGPAWETSLPFGDRIWTLAVFATPAYLQAHGSWLAWAVGVAGLLLSALTQVLLLAATGRADLIRRDERERVDRELKSVRAALERTAYEITENIPVGTYTMVLSPGTAMARFSFMSTRFLQLTGLDREEAEKDPLKGFACVHPDDYDDWVRLNAEAFALKRPFFGQTRVIVDNEVRWITAESIPRDLPDGSTVWEGVLIDVTDRVLAQRRSEQSEARLRKILDNLPVPIAIYELGASQSLTFLNEDFVRTFGYRLHDIPTLTHWGQSAYPDTDYRNATLETWNDAVNRALQAHTVVEAMEFRIIDKAGVPRDVIFSAVPLDDLLLVALVDITHRKQVESDLRQAKQHAESMHRAKSEFLAHMSHEIRTPLNAVLGFAQVLYRGPLETSQREMVSHIMEAGRSLLSTINDILDFSKIEAGQLNLESFPFDPSERLTKLVALMRPSAAAKGLELRLEEPSSPMGWLLGDALRLEQVLLNLVGNAIKFTERGRVTIRGDIEFLDGRQRRLCVSVTDTGIGIAPEALEHLFMPFSQAEAGITRKYGGTGLGLSISKRIVEMMGGRLGVQSQPGEGSRFWVEIPFEEVEASGMVAHGEPRARIAPPAMEKARLAGLRFLVVDDSAMNRQVVEQALILEGAMITTAMDGQQAIEVLTRRPDAFDAVLMDVRMPVMDGLTATRLIREELGLRHLPIIALTAGVLPDEQAEIQAAGLNAILTKPLDLERLLVMLRRWTGPDRGPRMAPDPNSDPDAGPADLDADGR